MAKSMVRVLLVDDFESFRRFVVSALGTRPELQIVGEASDGLEAVKKAEELQPDLILLDIGLPKLNGIEAARRIRERSPHSKILFISANASIDVVRGALATGAAGYLVKSNAGRELLTAIDTVLRGDQFLGTAFTSQLPSRKNHQDVPAVYGRATLDSRTLENCNPGQDLALPRAQKANGASTHSVYFYTKEVSLQNGVASFIEGTLKTGDAVIVVATEPHRRNLLLRLEALGLDIEAVERQGRYISFDAVEALSTFMANGLLDSARFQEIFGDAIMKAANAAEKKRCRVAVFGECVDLLLKGGNTEATIQMEKLANVLAKQYSVDILCAYSLTGVQRTGMFDRICQEHSAIYCG